MENKYSNLYNLIEENTSAGSYYNSLPEYVQETISERANNILTESDLYSYAENLLRGDK